MQKFAATIFTLLVICGLSFIPAQAQGRYRGKFYSKADVNRIIVRVEERSDAFRKSVDNNLNHSRLDDTRREMRINTQVAQFETALDELRREFDRRDTFREVRREVERVMRQSDEINALMRAGRFNPRVEQQWRLLRADLNRLAGIYELPLLRG
ncbi:MAG: hypothetical protein HYR56_04695 [Acidobacteria bacterium]|nr:hypothetical protein [Acidobacteriota bacterium]MBI3426015.1 hypothetical protein [Acidobacteriota bacterium]